MTARTATWPFPARLRTQLQIDSVLLTIVLALLLGGFVILASASISISDNATNNPFFYVQRQLIAAAIGGAAGFVCLYVPMQVWRSFSLLLLFVGLALLVVV
jgi:cell division protein FtsW